MVVFQGNIAGKSEVSDLLNVVSLEGQISIEHEVEDDPQTESINLIVVLLHLVDLRSDKPWSPCVFFVLRQFFQLVFVDPKAKVNDFDSFDDLFPLAHDDLVKIRSTMIFSGLRSLWMMPISLRYKMASVSCLKMTEASYSSRNDFFLV